MNTVSHSGFGKTKPVEFDGFRKQVGINNFALRLRKLNRIAIQQMRLLTDDSGIKQLETEGK